MSQLSRPDTSISPISQPATSGVAATPSVELIADLSCPWCYIAFRRLRRLQQEASLVLVWRPFLLNPFLPAEGMERRLYRARKFGSIEASRRLDRRLAEVGEQDGIAFDFERIARTPQTIAAQGLLLEAQRRGVAELAAERLFAAMFAQGRDIGDHRELLLEARHLGLDWAEPAPGAAPPNAAAVTASHDRACAAGISGVPLLVFRPGLSIAGAQSLEALRAMRDLARYRLRAEATPAPSFQGRQAS
jgi:predicted DsbA family dithiol-disulfide isomerase